MSTTATTEEQEANMIVSVVIISIGKKVKTFTGQQKHRKHRNLVTKGDSYGKDRVIYIYIHTHCGVYNEMNP